MFVHRYNTTKKEGGHFRSNGSSDSGEQTIKPAADGWKDKQRPTQAAVSTVSDLQSLKTEITFNLGLKNKEEMTLHSLYFCTFGSLEGTWRVY